MNMKKINLFIIMLLSLLLVTGCDSGSSSSSSSSSDEVKENEKANEKEDNTISESDAQIYGESLYMKARKSYYGLEEREYKAGYVKIINLDTLKESFTDKGFKQLLDYYGIKEDNGIYYKLDADRGSDYTYKGHELTIKKIEENIIIFNSKEIYESETKNNEFVIAKDNGVWKIDSYILPD